MRTAAAAVLGSVAAHVAIGACVISALLAIGEPGAESAAAAATAAPELPSAPAVPAPAAGEPVIDVAIIDVGELAVAPEAAAPMSHEDRATVTTASRAHMAATAATTVASAETRTRTSAGTGSGYTAEPPAPAAGTGAPNKLMTMRAPTLGVPDDVLERIAQGGKPPPAPIVASGKLQNTGGGRAEIRDAVTTVKVAPDGTAHFDDKRDIDLHVDLPIPTIGGIRDGLRGAGQVLGQWYQDPYENTRAGSAAELPKYAQAHPGECTSNDDMMCNGGVDDGARGGEGERRPNGTVPLIGGKLDLGAYLMRKFHNGDPFEARKRKLLEDTFAERAEHGAQHNAVERGRSAELMEHNLEWMWSSTADPGDRKRLLFEMWDDCTEDDAGTRARAMVIGWIAGKLPAGSAAAFTSAELAALDARRTSTQHFAPYAASAANVAP